MEYTMKQKFRNIHVIALLLSALSLSACASADTSNAQAGFYGSAAQPASASRTIVVGPQTDHVNVVQGDVVKFVVGDKAFAWNFDVSDKMWEMDLNRLAPPGTLDHTVKVYIEQNHIYTSGG
jgi:Heavy-metal resistance protein CzcE